MCQLVCVCLFVCVVFSCARTHARTLSCHFVEAGKRRKMTPSFGCDFAFLSACFVGGEKLRQSAHVDSERLNIFF